MDMKNIMHQAQEMQKKLQSSQEEMKKKIYIGESGGGMIKLSISGSGEAKKISIDSSLLSEEKSILEDLIVVAFNNARKKKEEDSKNALGDLKLPFGFKF